MWLVCVSDEAHEVVGDVCRHAYVEVFEDDRDDDVQREAGRGAEVGAACAFPFAVGDDHAASFLEFRRFGFFRKEPCYLA